MKFWYSLAAKNFGQSNELLLILGFLLVMMIHFVGDILIFLGNYFYNFTIEPEIFNMRSGK